MPDTLSRPTAASIASAVKKHAPAVRKSQRSMHHMSASVREADYQGHHIVIRTTYDIRVDGVPLMGHLGVTNDGQVHYHAVPNLSFASAIDTVKRVIDVFPDDFAGPPRRTGSTTKPGMGSMQMRSGHSHSTGGRRKTARRRG